MKGIEMRDDGSHTSHDRLFGELRSHLQAANARDEDWARTLLGLSEKARLDSEGAWRDVWVPYLGRALAASPEPLLRVTSLNALEHAAALLPGAYFSLQYEGPVEDVIQTPSLPRVSHLECLASVLYGGDEVALLARCQGLANLTSLKLEGHYFGAEGAHALATSPCFARLTHLSLDRNDLGVEGARAIANATSLAGITHLDLNHNELGDEGVEVLSQATGLAGVTHLSLEGNEVGEGFAVLARSRVFPRLTHLFCSYNEMDDDALQALASSPLLGQLLLLDLASNYLNDSGVQALATSPHGTKLRYLYLDDNDIGNAGARALATSSSLSHLQDLGLSNNRLGDDAVEAFANAVHVQHLSYLNLSDNNCSEMMRERAHTTRLGALMDFCI